MKVNELEKLGLLGKTISEADISHVRLVVSDEFNREALYTGNVDYRESAIKRLIKLGKKLGLRFQSETNIIRAMAEQFISLKCAFCNRRMRMGSSHGNFDHTTFEFNCVCGAKGAITIPANGIVFEPKKKEDA